MPSCAVRSVRADELLGSGVLAVIPPVGWAVLAGGLPIWTLIASWLVFARQRGAPDGAVAAVSTPVS
jgi:hypothetical protein